MRKPMYEIKALSDKSTRQGNEGLLIRRPIDEELPLWGQVKLVF